MAPWRDCCAKLQRAQAGQLADAEECDERGRTHQRSGGQRPIDHEGKQAPADQHRLDRRCLCRRGLLKELVRRPPHGSALGNPRPAAKPARSNAPSRCLELHRGRQWLKSHLRPIGDAGPRATPQLSPSRLSPARWRWPLGQPGKCLTAARIPPRLGDPAPHRGRALRVAIISRRNWDEVRINWAELLTSWNRSRPRRRVLHNGGGGAGWALVGARPGTAAYRFPIPTPGQLPLPR